MDIAQALLKVQEQIQYAAGKSGRSPDKINLITVSKTVKVQRVFQAVQAGAVVFGENRVQEALKKIPELKTLIASHTMAVNVEWHLIGSLQKNKVKTAVELFDLIHSVDSEALATEINRQAGKIDKIQRVLLQVKLSEEATKHGVMADSLTGLLEKVDGMDHIKCEGLMTIPPYFEDPEITRPYFRRLRELSESAIKKGYAMNELSMGMSNDFSVAVEEGATLVRVGTAIFGQRNYQNSGD